MATRSTWRSAASSRTWPASSTPGGERFQIFGEGGGQELADELDVPLLGQGAADDAAARAGRRRHAAASSPIPTTRPSQAIRHAARGLIAMFPAELPMLQAVPAGVGAEEEAPAPTGFSLPMAQG